MTKTNCVEDFYQVGGNLRWDHSSYVRRQADKDVVSTIERGTFGYIFGPYQIGKSSLVKKSSHHLRQRGYRSITIYANQLSDSSQMSLQWYTGLLASLWGEFYDFYSLDFIQWLQATTTLSPLARLNNFVEQFLFDVLERQPIVLFIDEIGYLGTMPASGNDFFRWISHCYRLRKHHAAYRNINFVIAGTAISLDFMLKNSDLFTSENEIVLKNFSRAESDQLAFGFRQSGDISEKILSAIFAWTQGQPFLTQSLCNSVSQSLSLLTLSQCKKMFTSTASINRWIDQLVDSTLIQDWRYQDEPLHLKPICDRILLSPNRMALLSIVRKLIKDEPVFYDGSYVQSELILSGLVSLDDEHLQIMNNIYRCVFDYLASQSDESLQSRV